MVLHGTPNNTKERTNTHTETKNRDQLMKFFKNESNRTNNIDTEGFYRVLKHLSIFLFKSDKPE
jgi:hypothetical protein